MEKSTALSLILMATEAASKKSHADFAAISLAAEAINHAAPTHQDLLDSVSWLLNSQLIVKQAKKYTLSNDGAAMLASAREQVSTKFELWDKLDIDFAALLDA